MLKLNANGKLLIGLSLQNIDKLIADEPLIVTDLEQLGLPPLEIAILVGENQHAIIDQFHKAGVFSDEEAREGHAMADKLAADHGGVQP